MSLAPHYTEHYLHGSKGFVEIRKLFGRHMGVACRWEWPEGKHIELTEEMARELLAADAAYSAVDELLERLCQA